MALSNQHVVLAARVAIGALVALDVSVLLAVVLRLSGSEHRRHRVLDSASSGDVHAPLLEVARLPVELVDQGLGKGAGSLVGFPLDTKRSLLFCDGVFLGLVRIARSGRRIGVAATPTSKARAKVVKATRETLLALFRLAPALVISVASGICLVLSDLDQRCPIVLDEANWCFIPLLWLCADFDIVAHGRSYDGSQH